MMLLTLISANCRVLCSGQGSAGGLQTLEKCDALNLLAARCVGLSKRRELKAIVASGR